MCKEKHYYFTILICLWLSACGITAPLPANTILNQTPYSLYLTEIDLMVPSGQTFKPVIFAEGHQPPTIAQLEQFQVKQLVDHSLGSAITLQHGTLRQPVYGYLVLYHHSNPRYTIKLTPEQQRQLQQGRPVLAYGLIAEDQQNKIGWALWLDKKMIDEGCTC